MKSNEERKIIARYLINAIGGTPQISKYWDENENTNINIFTIKDLTQVGINFYSTIGTSEGSIGLKVDEVPLRVELIWMCDSKEKSVPNMLATSAFCIINSKYKCYPGAIFHGIIEMYIDDSDMKHIMFVNPFLFEDKLNELKLNDKIIEWLLAVPISEEECKYAKEHGSDALQDLFEEYEIDIYNLYRESIL